MKREYKDFKEYMEYNYYDDIKRRLDPYIVSKKDSFENEDFYEITWIDMNEISYTVCGVTFKETDDGYLEIRTSVDAEVPFSGKTRYGRDSDGATKTYNVFFKAKLDNGLHDVKITEFGEYNKATYDKDKSLSQDLVPYLYEEAIEKNAEDFLKRNYPKALLQPMPLPVEEIVEKMGMKMYFAPMPDNIFGMTYFAEETVSVYDDIIHKNEIEIVTAPGTMLINPDVYFMGNIGTANNTIIHECVHWDRHRRAFELQKLLQGECNHISCEIVEGEYNGIGADESALKWMEWQANQLAPRILMPAEMTKRKLNDLLIGNYQNDKRERYSVHLENAIYQLASYFQVSVLAAKLRAIELGYDQAHGVWVYCDEKYIKPFSFKKGTLAQNQTFVLDEMSAMRQIYINPFLRELYQEGLIVYSNCMVCINDPKYVAINDVGEPELTEYALEHVHECCFIFKRKISASDSYSDTFYRRCFLCRDVDAAPYIEPEYDEEHKDNQDKKAKKEEIHKIKDSLTDIVAKMKEVPNGFGKTLEYHMKRKGLTNETMGEKANLSSQTISQYRNDELPNMTLGSAAALCNGLKLERHYAHDLMKKARYDLLSPGLDIYMISWLIDEHIGDNLQEWQDKLVEANIKVQIPGCEVPEGYFDKKKSK